MKKLFAILLLALSSSLLTICEAQFNVYHPFPDSNAWWSEWNAINGNIKYYDYYVRGDTIVNGKTYIKLNNSGGKQNNTWQSYDILYCLLRQDTSAKRIYISFKPTYRDTLLYDFNLKVGDTLPPTYNNNPVNKNYVKAIDSILIGTRYRKQFIINTHLNGWQCSLIEGIGSTQGLIEPMKFLFELNDQLLCFKERDTTVYPYLNDSCQIFVLGVPTLNKEKSIITLFPNPNNGRFTIESSVVSHKSQVELYNMLGEKVYTVLMPQTPKGALSQIDLTGKSAGIYLYRVITETGDLVSEGKFVIQ